MLRGCEGGDIFFKGVVGKISFIFLAREITMGKCINFMPHKSIHLEDASVRCIGKVLFAPVFQVINQEYRLGWEGGMTVCFVCFEEIPI